MTIKLVVECDNCHKQERLPDVGDYPRRIPDNWMRISNDDFISESHHFCSQGCAIVYLANHEVKDGQTH